MSFAEAWLRAHPGDDDVLQLYAASAWQRKQAQRLDAFLRAGLTNRPVRIEWNRLYQTLHDHPAERADLLRQYEQLLETDPTNSAWLYLRGRLETDRANCRSYFQRAAESDPKNPFPAFALGFDRMAAANWAEARPLLAQAAELKPRDERFGALLFTTRLALGEAPALERELQQKLAREPFNYTAEFELLDAMAAQDKAAEALQSAEQFVEALPRPLWLARPGPDKRGELPRVLCQWRFRKIESRGG